MILYSFVYSLILAVFITLLFYYIMKEQGPWNNYWLNLAIVFLVIFITSLWVKPLKPAIYEIQWIPPLIAGIVIAVFLAAARPSTKTRRKLEDEYKHQSNDSRVIAVGFFFWILLFLLIGIVVAGLFYQ